MVTLGVSCGFTINSTSTAGLSALLWCLHTPNQRLSSTRIYDRESHQLHTPNGKNRIVNPTHPTTTNTITS